MVFYRADLSLLTAAVSLLTAAVCEGEAVSVVSLAHASGYHLRPPENCFTGQ